MRITRLEVAGYGIWSGLRVEDFGPGLNVIYGPNEAGKTTLLEFLRWVLYGTTPQRRRYLPPLHGGTAGGSLHLATANGTLEIARYCPDPADAGHGQTSIRSADGAQHGTDLLASLLAGVDEATFRNVFAVSLRELQELAALGDTQAADLLYNLSIGVDGRWVLEVMRDLEGSRRRIINGPDAPAQLLQLLAERDRLRRQAAELRKAEGTYPALLDQRRQLDTDISALQSQRCQVQEELRRVELAARLAQPWQQRSTIEQQLAGLPSTEISPRIVERFDRLVAAIQRSRRHVLALRRRCRELARAASAIQLRKALWRQAARIEALNEQQAWLKSLHQRLGQLEDEVGAIRELLDETRQRLAVSDPENLKTMLQTPTATLRGLRPAIKALAQARRAVREAKQALAAARRDHAALAAELETALSALGEKDLAAALDRVGQLAAQCRHTVQLDHRIEQTIEHQQELERQALRWERRQVLPLWLLAVLGAVFALGVMLVLAGLLLPGALTGSLGWAMAVLGVGGVAVAAGGKLALERANAKALESSQKQLLVLQSQLQQLQQQRHDLQQQLAAVLGETAAVGGAARLADAERRLAALEELSPLQSRVNAAADQVRQCHTRLAQAKAQFQTARRQWAEALAAASLPQSLSPRQLRSLLFDRRNVEELVQRLKLREEELAQRRAEWNSFAARIEQLCADAGLTLDCAEPLQILQHLSHQLAVEREAARQRASIVRQRRRLRRRWQQRRAALARLSRRRRKLLAHAGVQDENQLRQRAELAARAASLRAQRDTLDNQIAELLSGCQDQQAIRDMLGRFTAAQLEQQRERLQQQLSASEDRLQQFFRRQGQLEEQLKTLGSDRRLGFKRLELNVNAERIRQAIGRWQLLALCGRLLESLCRAYETDRQPETLRAASQYLQALTGGRFQRVWTPLGERALRIDQADGCSLPVEALSRGTREQLFLSLRLALADWYAKRGALLPLILDDVLVNFDAQRAKAAARLLHQFAEGGHQLLVFTCHEHILALFAELEVPLGRLPDCNRPNPPPLRLSPLRSSKEPLASAPAPADVPPPAAHSRRQLRRPPPPPAHREAKPAAESSPPVDVPATHSAPRSFDADYFDSRELAAASTAGRNSGSNGAAGQKESPLADGASA